MHEVKRPKYAVGQTLFWYSTSDKNFSERSFIAKKIVVSDEGIEYADYRDSRYLEDRVFASIKESRISQMEGFTKTFIALSEEFAKLMKKDQ